MKGDRLTPGRALAATFVRSAIGLGALVFAFLFAQNVVLNVTLPLLLAQHADRLHLSYAWAWMVWPGRVHVHDLVIAVDGNKDRVITSAHRARGTIDLGALLHRRFHVDGLRASGVRIAYVKFPLPAPRPPRDPWLVDLADVTLDELTDVWVGSQHFSGLAHATGSLLVAGRTLDLDAHVSLIRVAADADDVPIARELHGEVALLIDAVDRTHGSEGLRNVSARAQLSGDVEDLRFLDVYLADVPWLALAGEGEARFDLGVERGSLVVGSTLDAEFPDLHVRYVTNDVAGAGTLSARVVRDPTTGAPMSRLDFTFDDFTIASDDVAGALVEGRGFHVVLASPDVGLQEPFTTVDATFDLPASRIPHITRYNAFLPRDVGLALTGGTATLRGRLRASTRDDLASGEVFLDGDDWVVVFEPFTSTFDVALHALLVDTQVGTGVYDITGTTLELRDVGLVNGHTPRANAEGRPWWARLTLPSGHVRAGSPVYLDAFVHFETTDSTPFVAVFVDRARLPPWALGPLRVTDVYGTARVEVGQDTLQLDPCEIVAGAYRLDLRYRRAHGVATGDLYTRAGPFSLAIGLAGKDTVIRVGAKPLDHTLPIGSLAADERR